MSSRRFADAGREGAMIRGSRRWPAWMAALALVTAFIALALALATPVEAGSGRKERPALAPGWNRIAAGEGTGCLDGGEYAFYVRPGSPTKLAFVFMGGGPCWSGATCDTCSATGDHRRLTSAAPRAAGL